MITGIILASGFSKRMKKDKLLMEIHGIKMVERVIRACKGSLLDEIILIYRKEEVKSIGQKYGIKLFYNPNAHLGQSAGVRLGVNKAGKSDAYMFIMGDQPFINSYLINRLINEYKKNNSTIAVPYYNGKKGTPTIFSSAHREELLDVHGDVGGRDIIEKYSNEIIKVHIDDEKLGLDIDTFEDFRNILK
ncbi:MAG TPA: nucleotidyltransferase family protein [Tepidimicrobium sp.]|nr:nucleotidyltransferase family protein [Tepidimicrobium sp.]